MQLGSTRLKTTKIDAMKMAGNSIIIEAEIRSVSEVQLGKIKGMLVRRANVSIRLLPREKEALGCKIPIKLFGYLTSCETETVDGDTTVYVKVVTAVI